MVFLFISSFPISFLTHLFICFPSFPLIFRFFSDCQQYYGIPHFYGILHSTRFIHLSPIHTLPTLSHLHPLHSQTTSASARPCQIAPIRRKPRLYSSCPHHPTISNPLQRLIFVEPFKPLSTRTSPSWSLWTPCHSILTLTRDCKQPSPYADDQSLYHAGEASYRLCISHDPCMSTFCTNNHMTSLQQSIRIITPSWHHSIISSFHSPLPICCVIAASQLLHHHRTALCHACIAIGHDDSGHESWFVMVTALLYHRFFILWLILCLYDSFFIPMTHSPFLCIGFVLFFEIAQSRNCSVITPEAQHIHSIPPFHCPLHCPTHCLAYTDVRRYYTLYKPCTLATEQSTSSVHHSMSILLWSLR